jgi:hypothetical protein
LDVVALVFAEPRPVLGALGDAGLVGREVDGLGTEVSGGVDEHGRNDGAVPVTFDHVEALDGGLDTQVGVENRQDETPSGAASLVLERGRVGQCVEAVTGEIAGLKLAVREEPEHATGGSGWADAGPVEVHRERECGQVLLVFEAVVDSDDEVDVEREESLLDYRLSYLGVVAGADVEPTVGVGGGVFGVDGPAS